MLIPNEPHVTFTHDAMNNHIFSIQVMVENGRKLKYEDVSSSNSFSERWKIFVMDENVDYGDDIPNCTISQCDNGGTLYKLYSIHKPIRKFFFEETVVFVKKKASGELEELAKSHNGTVHFPGTV